jgi:hypothetical protein
MNLKPVFGVALPFACAIARFLSAAGISSFCFAVWVRIGKDSGMVIIHWAGAIYPSLKEKPGKPGSCHLSRDHRLAGLGFRWQERIRTWGTGASGWGRDPEKDGYMDDELFGPT